MSAPPPPPPRAGRRRRRSQSETDEIINADGGPVMAHALVAHPPPTVATAAAAPRRAPKPNRQRCKEFRERRKHHVSEMDERVSELRTEVSSLIMKKSIYSSKAMLKRHHPHGSLERLVREYFALFSHGVAVERSLPLAPDAPPSKAQQQWEFLQRVVDPVTVYGDHKGPAGAIAQWGYYTAAYASFVGQVNRVTLAGSEEDPILYCYTTYHVILSRTTIKFLFPHVLHNEGLVQRMIGLYVPCSVVGIYRFTLDGHIISETADIELAEALLGAGCRVDDVDEMMRGFVINKEGIVPDELQAEEYHFMEDIGIPLDGTVPPFSKDAADDDAAAAAAKEKLRISFLLAQGDDDESKSGGSSTN